MEKKNHCHQEIKNKNTNIFNHMANLSILHGFFYKGTFYWNGEPQPHSHKIPKHGRIFTHK